jgi:large repetitive protein
MAETTPPPFTDTLVWTEGGAGSELTGGGPAPADSACLSCSVSTYKCPNAGSSDAFWKRPITGVNVPVGVQVVAASAKIWGASVSGSSGTTSVQVKLNGTSLGTIQSANRTCADTTANGRCDGGANGTSLPATGTMAVNDWKPAGGNQLIFVPSSATYCLSQIELTLKLKQRLLQASPSPLSFGNQKNGARSAPQTLTLSNTGDVPVEISGLAITNPTQGTFEIVKVGSRTIDDSNDLAQALPFTLSNKGDSKIIQVVFLPLTSQPNITGTLRVTSNAAGSPMDVTLMGNGVGFSADVSPEQLVFSDVRVTQSDTLTVKVRNVGTSSSAIRIDSISINGGEGAFTFAPSVGTPFLLFGGYEKEVNVRFTPNRVGSFSGQLQVDSNDTAKPLSTVVLSGTGVLPRLEFEPEGDGGLDFGKILVGDAGTGWVKVRNAGSLEVTLGEARVEGTGGPFTIVQAMDGGGLIDLPADSGFVDLQVRYKPTLPVGPATGNLLFTSPDGGVSALRYPLAGQGVTPILEVEPADGGGFGDVRVDTTAQRWVTIRNKGSGDILVNAVQVDGGPVFALDGGSSSFALAADGGSRNVLVEFHPTVKDTAVVGSLQFSTEYPTLYNPAPYPLSGRGVEPALVFDPLDGGGFGDVRVGQTDYRLVTVRNKGSGTITLKTAGVDGGPQFSLDGGPDNVALAPDGGLQLAVMFRPSTELAVVQGTLHVEGDDSKYNPVPYVLSGRGVQPHLVLIADGGSDFGSVQVGGGAASKVVTLRNDGSQDIKIVSVGMVGNTLFKVVGAPSNFTLATDGGSRDVTVAFTPVDDLASVSDRFRVASTDPEFDGAEVALQGRGVKPNLVLEPAGGYDFHDVQVNGTGQTTVVLRNRGTQGVMINAVRTNHLRFTVDAGTGAFFLDADGGTRELAVQYKPDLERGVEDAGLQVQSGFPMYDPALYPLWGRGVQPKVVLNPPEAIRFGQVRVNTDGGTTLPVVVTNEGSAPIQLSDIRLESGGDPDFTLEGLPATKPYPPLDAGTGRMEFRVRYNPRSVRVASATSLRFLSDDPLYTSQKIDLYGQGVLPTLELYPSDLLFEEQAVGTLSAEKEVRFKNTETGTLRVFDIAISGPFVVDSKLDFPLEKGQEKILKVRFKPTEQGEKPGALSFKTNDPEHAQLSVLLKGKGTSRLVASRDTIAFNEVPVNMPARQSITFSNEQVGAAPITISEMSSDSDQFGYEGFDAGVVVDPATNPKVSFTVTFTPTTTGQKEGWLTVKSNSTDNPTQKIHLLGKGTKARALISVVNNPAADSLEFGDVLLSATPQEKVRIANGGDAPLNVSNIRIVRNLSDGGVVADSTVFKYIGPATPVIPTDGGYLDTAVSFAPPDELSYQAALEVGSDGSDTPVRLPLRGTGVAAHIGIKQTSLTFPDQRIKQASAPQALDISNDGGASLQVSAITAPTGFYAVSEDGGSPFPFNVPGHETRSLLIAFRPEEEGFFDGGLRPLSNARDNAQVIPVQVRGRGVDGILDIQYPDQGDFGTRDVGVVTSRSIYVRNAGQGPLKLLSVGIAAPSVEGSFIAPKLGTGITLPDAYYPISVTFQPQVNGYQAATLVFTTDSQTKSVHQMTVWGTGDGADVAQITDAVIFPNTNQGTSSTRSVRIRNSGSKILTVERISFEGSSDGGTDGGASGYVDMNFDYGVAPLDDGGTRFPMYVDGGAQIDVPLVFTPTATGTRDALGNIQSNARRATFAVKGTGTSPVLDLSPDSGILLLDGVMVGTDSAPKPIIITNTGNGPITFKSVTFSGSNAFSVTPSLPVGPLTIRGGGESARYLFRFRPTADHMDESAALQMQPELNGGPSIFVRVEGRGSSTPISAEKYLDFGVQLINNASASRPLTVTNNTETGITLKNVSITGANQSRFTLLTTVQADTQLVRNTPLKLELIFNPESEDTANATLRMEFSHSVPAIEVPLKGKGVSVPFTISPTPFNFGTYRLKDEPLETLLKLTSNLTDPITLAKPRIKSSTGEAFDLDDLFALQGQQLTANNPVNVKVRYHPTVPTASRVTLSFFGLKDVKTQAETPWSVDATLQGSAAERILTAYPAEHKFDRLETSATEGQTKTFEIENISTKDQLLKARLRVGDDSQFSLDARELSNIIPAGKKANISVTFKPTKAGDMENAVEVFIESERTTAELVIPLTGAGNVFMVHGSGCACGVTEPGSAGALLLLALAGHRWRRRRE